MAEQYLLIFIGVISITALIIIIKDTTQKKKIKSDNSNSRDFDRTSSFQNVEYRKTGSSNSQSQTTATEILGNINNNNVNKEPIVKHPNLEYISLEHYLKVHGIVYIDNRPKGGALWVVDIYDNFKNMKTELLKKGIDFRLAEHGGKASNHRKAWYTKNVDDPQYLNIKIRWLIPNEDYSTSKINYTVPIKKSESFNYEHTIKERQEKIKTDQELITEQEMKDFKLFFKSEEEKMNDYNTAHTCRNCMLQRAQECVGAKQICEFFKYAPRLDK